MHTKWTLVIVIVSGMFIWQPSKKKAVFIALCHPAADIPIYEIGILSIEAEHVVCFSFSLELYMGNIQNLLYSDL